MNTTYAETPVLNEFLTKAKRKIKCIPSEAEKEDLKDVIRIEGAHPAIWDTACEQIEVNLNRNSKLSKEKLQNVIIAYRDLCDRNVLADCPYCQKSGYLSVILLRCGRKVYVYDPDNMNTKANLMNHYMAGKPITGEWSFQPCTCKNGDKRNKKSSQYWNTDNNRRLCRDRCFRGEQAEFYLNEHLNMINAIASGRTYTMKNPEEEYKRLKALEAGQ
jgi:hypothetical protein